MVSSVAAIFDEEPCDSEQNGEEEDDAKDEECECGSVKCLKKSNVSCGVCDESEDLDARDVVIFSDFFVVARFKIVGIWEFEIFD